MRKRSYATRVSHHTELAHHEQPRQPSASGFAVLGFCLFSGGEVGHDKVAGFFGGGFGGATDV